MRPTTRSSGRTTRCPSGRRMSGLAARHSMRKRNGSTGNGSQNAFLPGSFPWSLSDPSRRTSGTWSDWSAKPTSDVPTRSSTTRGARLARVLSGWRRSPVRAHCSLRTRRSGCLRAGCEFPQADDSRRTTAIASGPSVRVGSVRGRPRRVRSNVPGSTALPAACRTGCGHQARVASGPGTSAAHRGSWTSPEGPAARAARRAGEDPSGQEERAEAAAVDRTATVDPTWPVDRSGQGDQSVPEGQSERADWSGRNHSPGGCSRFRVGLRGLNAQRLAGLSSALGRSHRARLESHREMCGQSLHRAAGPCAPRCLHHPVRAAATSLDRHVVHRGRESSGRCRLDRCLLCRPLPVRRDRARPARLARERVRWPRRCRDRPTGREGCERSYPRYALG